MSTETVEWIVPLFFLGVLVLVSRMGRQISSVSRESYRLITGGLSVLAFMSLMGLYRGQGMLGDTPFLSEAIFFDLITWIFGITGSVFVLSGVANWLPLARDRKLLHANAVRKLELLRRTEQLLGVESRLDPILANTVEYMVSHFSMDFGAVYKYSRTRGKMCLGGGTTNLPLAARRIDLQESGRDRLTRLENGVDIDLVSLFDSICSGVKTPLAVLPLWVSQRPVGFFVLWGAEDTSLTRKDDLILRLAIDAVGRKIETDKLALRYDSEVKARTWKNQLEVISGGSRTARESFSPLVQCLGQRIPVDFASLTMIDEAGESMMRLSWGPGGRVLAETGLAVPTQGMLTAEVYRSGQTVVENDLDSGSQATPGEIVTDGNAGSLLAAPIVIGGSCRAVITLASRDKDAYADWELKDLELAMPALERLVADEQSRRAIRLRENRTARLSRFVDDMTGFGNLNELFAAAASLVADVTGADIVRISTPNSGGAFLKSRALVRSRPFEITVPANGELIVSLMPLHEQVLRNDQSMLHGGSETAGGPVDFECQQAFAPGVKSVMIVPVSQGGQGAAVISAASMNHNCALHRDAGSMAFVESLARCLMPAIRKSSTGVRELSAEPEPRDITAADREIVARLSDSLERGWATSDQRENELLDQYERIIERPPSRFENLFERELVES
ncbi:MAG: GAF domain-containing protein [bacterium]|nr:GAF domain-containing protein [bacterium]